MSESRRDKPDRLSGNNSGQSRRVLLFLQHFGFVFAASTLAGLANHHEKGEIVIQAVCQDGSEEISRSGGIEQQAKISSHQAGQKRRTLA